MGKVLRQLAIAAVVIGASFLLPGSPQIAAALFAAGTGMALATVSQALFGPKMPKAQASRLNATFEPQAHRKFVFGATAMNTDIRYYETSGTDQEYFDYIIATSAHEVESIDEIWFDDEIAWDSSTGVASKYSGYLTISTRAVGTSANTISINGGGIWGSSCRLTGCSYIYVRLKRTGNSKKAESPLVNGLPNRLTIKGKGAKIYDPRLDSTVTGGSGSHRANDQTTWGTANSTNRDNPALQLLWFLLGWKINGKLSVGCGVPYERIDLASFITAANICDEAITLAAGGTQPRYRTAGVGSDADNRMDIIQLFLTCMNGTLRDSNGRLSVQVMKNDLATPVLSFDDDDVLEGFTWNQTNGLDKTINAVHGKYSDSSNNSLYQSVEYPTVSISSVDSIERLQTLDLPWVEDGKRAQRIAKQVLQRAQYKGVFSTTFSMKALGCEVGDVVYISFGPLGWSNKPFRILTQVINSTGRVPMTMIEENAAIYAWDAEEQAVVTPTAPTVYDPLNSPYILGIADAEALADGKITSFYQSSAPTAEGIGDIWIDTDDANKLYRWSGSAWVLSRDTGITTAISAAADAQATADGKVFTFYTTSTPTAEAIGDLWYNPSNSQLKRWSGSAWVDVADITANVIPRHEPSDIATAFTANYQGIIDTGQLPKNIQITRYRGSTDVSSSSTWTIISQGGVTGGTVTVSNGVVTIPAGVTIPSSTEIIVKSTRDSFDLLSKIAITRLDAAPPNTGGGGGTTVNDSSFDGVSGTTLTVISDILTVKTGSNGQIVFSAPLEIYADAATPIGTFGAIAQWKYRPISGSFSNAGSQANEISGAYVYYDPEFLSYFADSGYIEVSATVTGLSANTDYEVQLSAARDSSSPAKTIYFAGTASATGS